MCTTIPFVYKDAAAAASELKCFLTQVTQIKGTLYKQKALQFYSFIEMRFLLSLDQKCVTYNLISAQPHYAGFLIECMCECIIICDADSIHNENSIF